MKTLILKNMKRLLRTLYDPQCVFLLCYNTLSLDYNAFFLIYNTLYLDYNIHILDYSAPLF